MLVVSVLFWLPLSVVVAYCYAKINRMMQSASASTLRGNGAAKTLNAECWLGGEEGGGGAGEGVRWLILQKPILILEFIVYNHILPYPTIQYTSSWPIRSITRFIIHSKYFPVSDWLKPHA